MKKFGELIYTREEASGEASLKAEAHTPVIEAPDTVEAGKAFQVKVRVGPQPNTTAHSIRYLDVYVYEEGRSFNPIHVARLTLTPEYSEPELTINLILKENSTIYVLAYCNLHGVWEARREIKVVKTSGGEKKEYGH